jgi:ABC-type nickel/cobalt efflux system permease component RcnA
MMQPLIHMARIRLPSVMIHRPHGHAHDHDHDHGHDHSHDHSHAAPQPSYRMLPQQEETKSPAGAVSTAAGSDAVDLKDASFNTQVRYKRLLLGLYMYMSLSSNSTCVTVRSHASARPLMTHQCRVVSSIIPLCRLPPPSSSG